MRAIVPTLILLAGCSATAQEPTPGEIENIVEAAAMNAAAPIDDHSLDAAQAEAIASADADRSKNWIAYHQCLDMAVRAFYRQQEAADTVARGALALCRYKRNDWIAALNKWRSTVEAEPISATEKVAAGLTATLHDDLVADVIARRSEAAAR